MGQLYVLKLRGRKWYVGYTDKAITRILQHAEKKGAKWTKKYPPVNPIPYWMSEPGYNKEDENRKAEVMKQLGSALNKIFTLTDICGMSLASFCLLTSDASEVEKRKRRKERE